MTTYYDHVHLRLRTALKPYYYQGVLARLGNFPKSDNPYGPYKEHLYVFPTQQQCKAEWNRGYEDKDAVFAGYLEKTE